MLADFSASHLGKRETLSAVKTDLFQLTGGERKEHPPLRNCELWNQENNKERSNFIYNMIMEVSLLSKMFYFIDFRDVCHTEIESDKAHLLNFFTQVKILKSFT